MSALEAMTRLRAAFDAFAAVDISALTRSELLAVADEYEALTCQVPSQRHRLLGRLQAEATPKALGAKSWNEVLRVRWRVSSAEAGRRLGEVADLAPRQSLTGQPLAPVLPAVAAAQAAGAITGEHVREIRHAVTDLPSWVDTTTAAQFEVDLVRVAVGVGPKELRDTAQLRLFLLDQDGPAPDDADRARKRGINVGPQGRDAMVSVRGALTPQAWAVWEVIFAKYAAPGMCNPADEQPCTSGTPTQAQIDADDRSPAQRRHDALLAVGRIAVMSGELGQLNGLPVAVIIRTTLRDLESRAGIGVTGGGTKLPITDVITMAGHANHYLAIFDGATGQALALYRGKRVASAAQRIMLIARDGGCTKPCCTVGAYGCQVHHASCAWANGGYTNVDEMTLACPTANRDAEDGWTTTINARGECEWTPPPDLDHGQTRINYYHRPEALLQPPDEEPPPDDQPAEASEPTPAKAKQHNDIRDKSGHHDPTDEPGHPDPTDTPGGPEPPGGPGPPGNQAA